jgi:hypothetical protein
MLREKRRLRVFGIRVLRTVFAYKREKLTGRLLIFHKEDFHNFSAVLPKPFSTATQFLERQSIATHAALLKKSSSKKIFFYIFLNIILQKTRSISHNEACVIGARVSGY